MKGELSDTSPAIEDIIAKRLKQKSIPQKLALVSDLTSLVRSLSKRAIARANPGKNKTELDLLFVKYNYGEDAYIKVSEYLQKIQK